MQALIRLTEYRFRYLDDSVWISTVAFAEPVFFVGTEYEEDSAGITLTLDLVSYNGLFLTESVSPSVVSALIRQVFGVYQSAIAPKLG
jgi:hypothetical protein